MKTKVAALLAIIIFISSVGGTSVFARPATDSRPALEDSKAAPASVPASKEKTARSDKLKSDLLKLVADTKAGKVAPRPQQFPNTKRNNLSTGAKIGIAAAIGGLIFALIVIHQVNDD